MRFAGTKKSSSIWFNFCLIINFNFFIINFNFFFRLNLGSLFYYLFTTILRLLLIGILFYLIYLVYKKKDDFNNVFSKESDKLELLKIEINNLKTNLQNAIFNSEEYRFNKFRQQTNQLTDTELDYKIFVILERLRASEREARLMELRDFERRILEQAKKEMSLKVTNYQSTLQDTAVESGGANSAQCDDNFAIIQSTNLTLERFKIEIERVFFII